MDRMAMIKAAAEKQQMQNAIRNIDRRKASIKKQNKKIKKAKHQAPGAVESFTEENMYWSEKETQNWFEGTSYFENYQAMRNQDSWD